MSSFYEVYREKVILGFDAIEDIDMRIFFNQKEMQSEKIAQWVDTTKKRLSNIYINYMIDANLLAVEGKQKKIKAPILDTALQRYLELTGK